MRVVIVGGRSFAVAVAERLFRGGADVVAVWTSEEDPLEEWAHREGLPALIEPDPADLKELEADLLVSVHNFKYVGPEFLRATRLGAIGYHPSLLPRHRGNDSVRDTIRAGDRVAGGTVYWLDEGLDTGPIAAQRSVQVQEGWDASALWREALFPLGVDLVDLVVQELAAGAVVKIPQEEVA